MIVQNEHIDIFGHVNNSKYMEFLEAARWDILKKGNYGPEVVMETKQGPVILEANLKFKKELALQDNLKIETEIIILKEKIWRINHKILTEEKGLCCIGIYTFGFFDLNKRKLIPMSEKWKSVIS